MQKTAGPSTGPTSTVTQRSMSSASSSTVQIPNGSTAPTTRTSTPQSLTMSDPHLKNSADSGVVATTLPAIPLPALGTSLASAVSKEDGTLSPTASVPEDKGNSWDKQSQSSSHAENKSSSGSRTPEVSKGGDLVPAAIPPVNPWKLRSESIAAKKPNPTVPALPAVPKTAASSNAVASVKATGEKADVKQAGKKERLVGGLPDTLERGNVEEASGGAGGGKEPQVGPKDRRRSVDAGKVNGFAAGADGMNAPCCMAF